MSQSRIIFVPLEKSKSVMRQSFKDNRIKSSILSRNTIIQKIPWHNQNDRGNNLNGVPNINKVDNYFKNILIDVAGYSFKGYKYTYEMPAMDNKIDLIIAISEFMSGVNIPEKKNFLTKKQLQGNLLAKSLNSAEISSLQKRLKNIYINNIDPFVICVSGKYNENTFALYYQFGNDSYGYIVRIEQEGKAYTMSTERGQKALKQQQISSLKKLELSNQHIFSQYSSAHDTKSNDNITYKASLSTLTTIHTERNKKERINELTILIEMSNKLDAITKVAGEGARWNCVRELAKTHQLTNDSIFYTINYHNMKMDYIGITFKSLWKIWDSHFYSKFGIENTEVTNVLLSLYDKDDKNIILRLLKEDIDKGNNYCLN